MNPVRVFMTVGSQMPFDRMSAAVAQWARRRPDVTVFAQVGRTRLRPGELDGIDWCPLLEPSDYLARSREADLLVAHAGMGSVLTAMELQRPLVVMPRRGALAETRNDHQVDTAEHLRKQATDGDAFMGGGHGDENGNGQPSRLKLLVADDEHALPTVLDRACWSLAQPLLDGLGPGPGPGPGPEPDALQRGAPGLSRSDLIAHLRGIIQARG